MLVHADGTYTCRAIFPICVVTFETCSQCIVQAWLELMVIPPQPQVPSSQEYTIMPNLLKVQYCQETDFYDSFTFLYML